MSLFYVLCAISCIEFFALKKFRGKQKGQKPSVGYASNFPEIVLMHQENFYTCCEVLSIYTIAFQFGFRFLAVEI